MENDNTQSSDTTPEVVKPNNPTPGVQERINELTGTIHEQRRQQEQMNQTIQDLIAQNAALAAKQAMVQPTNQPTTPTLPEGVDPVLFNTLSQTMQQTLSQQFQNLEAKFTQALGGVRQSQEQIEFQAATQGVDPKVAEEAQKLIRTWRANGFTGWTPEDAVVYAEGKLAKINRSNQSRLRPNGNGSDSVTQGGASTPNVSQTKLPPAKTDDELRRMSLAQQEAYWAARVGDSQIE